jgi:hypothetical protein
MIRDAAKAQVIKNRDHLGNLSGMTPPKNWYPPYYTKTNFHHVAHLVTFDSTGYELFKTSPLATWGRVEEEIEDRTGVSKISPYLLALRGNFEFTCDFLNFHSEFWITNKNWFFSCELPPVKLGMPKPDPSNPLWLPVAIIVWPLGVTEIVRHNE